MATSQRRLAAIMFTDMVGYSALAQSDEAKALGALDRHNQLLRPIFSSFRGREIKTVGDAFLVEFESALDAVRCAVEIQRTLHYDRSPERDEWKLRIRVGVHVGDVEHTDGDVLGDAVNIASRIVSLAEPGGVCLTQQVYDQVQNKVSTPFVRLPAVALKNIRIPMNLYRIVQPWEERPAGERVSWSKDGRRIAVLPLANISPDPTDEYFADGLTEELISGLSQIHDLTVIARTSVLPYKAAPKSVAQIGAELGVDAVLEGSVRKAGKRIRISLQLIDVGTQGHIWASSYDREVDDVFAVQSDIADRTAKALQLELTGGGRSGAKRRPTTNSEAYDRYLRGLVAGSRPHGAGFDEAIRWFDEATKLDPTFAEAFAAWANLYVVAAGDRMAMKDVMPRARELAGRALDLDPESSEAHSSLGNIALQFDHDWLRAETEFRKAISLNPSNVTATQFLGLLFMAVERYDEAKEVFRRAIQLDPGGGFQRLLAWAELNSGNFDPAIDYMQGELDRTPTSQNAHIYLGLFNAYAGRPADALREADWPLTDPDGDEQFDHALLAALVGRPDEARMVAAEAERGDSKSYTSAAHLAMLYAVLGETDKALALVEKDTREGDQILWLFQRGPYFDSIRNDPRFVACLRTLGLPTGSERPSTPAPGQHPPARFHD
ncbi:MAG TPA: adenylate/guanylate cyclase domain-containing protein [Thermoplasmata archaeon]|nr:adenylate/guanylate cyclase domain-containing protein [Thermoplasmata archaeon]